MENPTVESLNNKIDMLTNYIFNDKNTGRPGLVQEVDEMKRKIEGMADEKNIDKAKRAGMNVAFGAIGGFAIIVLKWILEVGTSLFENTLKHSSH